MHIKVRGVNQAFRDIVLGIELVAIPTFVTESRYGKVMQVDEPFAVTYTHPRERVLLNAERDANCFFHLYEALWMLAGRNDVAPLAYYNKRMMEFSDDGKTLNGAYGYRWRTAAVERSLEGIGKLAWHRQHGGVDQLDVIIQHLKTNPTSRRAVLQMWNVEDDLLKIGGTGSRHRCNRCHSLGSINLGPPEPDDGVSPDRWEKCPECKGTCWVDESASRDVACNTHIYFSIEPARCSLCQGRPYLQRTCIRCDGSGREGGGRDSAGRLNMTVCNRSNDLVWGMLGANVVHMSILQEYMAARIGVEVGTYTQFTNNLHTYLDHGERTKMVEGQIEELWRPWAWLKEYAEPNNSSTWYERREEVSADPTTVPLVQDPEAFEEELPRFVDRFSEATDVEWGWVEPFLQDVAQPMLIAFNYYKAKMVDTAIVYCKQIKAADWRTTAEMWLRKRTRKEVKSGKGTS